MKKEQEQSANLSEGDLSRLIKELGTGIQSGRPLIGPDGVFTPLLRRVLEASLEGELDAHLQESRKSQKNRRNGKKAKQVKSALGTFELLAPRDRSGTFQPQIVKKRQHQISSDIDGQILSLFSYGMSYPDIRKHLQEIYGIELSQGALTAITDRIIPEIKEWQNRPLENVYAVVWLDAMHFKVREAGKVVTKAIYSVLGVNCAGEKQILGLYFGDHESSTFWRQVLHDLQIRGIKDIFIACIDNLSGFGDAIEDIFPKTHIQLCLVHQMRNSMKYMGHKDIKPMVSDLRNIYTANNLDMASHYLQQAEEKWGQKYKVVFRSWHNNWERLTSFFEYPPALRRVIYTTNPIESYHRMVRKATKTKGAFTSEEAILKQIYLATLNAQTRWKGTMAAWPSVRRDLSDYFGERFLTNDTLH